jgi:uncharacterized membrane protein required for colicin V production
MIAATTNSQPGWSLDHLPVNWFDVTLIVVLVFGLYRGRKNGMSKEFLPLIEWVIAIVAATLAYPALTETLVNVAGLKWATGTYILAYLSVVGLVFFIFYFIKHSLKPKLGGTSIFGNGEYYLGMVAGLLRYACIVTFFLALLNAPIYSQADLDAVRAYNKKNYGGGLYEGNYLPDIPTIQEGVFKQSFLGRYIKEYCEPVLIQTDNSPNGKLPKKTQARTE